MDLSCDMSPYNQVATVVKKCFTMMSVRLWPCHRKGIRAFWAPCSSDADRCSARRLPRCRTGSAPAAKLAKKSSLALIKPFTWRFSMLVSFAICSFCQSALPSDVDKKTLSAVVSCTRHCPAFDCISKGACSQRTRKEMRLTAPETSLSVSSMSRRPVRLLPKTAKSTSRKRSAEVLMCFKSF